MNLAFRLPTELSTEKDLTQLLEHFRANPNCFNEVWLFTYYCYPSLQKHKEKAQSYAKLVELLKNEGFTVSLQLSNSLGHGQFVMAGDFSGVLGEGCPPIERMVGPDGAFCDYCYCWRGKNFKSYVKQVLAMYADVVKPTRFWVDDDFRAWNHKPVSFGCYCDDCIKTFNEKHGYSFTREELVEQIKFAEDKTIRGQYVEFIREGMSQMAREMGESIHSVSPDTAFGYQHGAWGCYPGQGLGFVYDAMYESTGLAPASRPGGGAYYDHDPNEILKKGQEVAYQISLLPPYVSRVYPEVESTPAVSFGKTPAGTALETSHYFACGATDMSYAIISSALAEPLEWYDNIFRLFSEQSRYWTAMSDVNKTTYGGGIRYFISSKSWSRSINRNQTIYDYNDERVLALSLIQRDALPITYDPAEQDLFFLYPDTAEVVSKEELDMLKSKAVITDGESIDILQKRGFDFGLEVHRMSFADTRAMKNHYCEHPITPKYMDTFDPAYFAPGRIGATCIATCPENTEILCRYERVSKIPCLMDSLPNPIADAIITTDLGGKWAILCNAPWKGVVPAYYRDYVLDIADYISGGRLCARILEPIQATLHVRKNKDGSVAAVSVTNCTVGPTGEFRLAIRNAAGKSFRFMSQYDGERQLTCEHKDGMDIVTVPSVTAWSVATVFVD